MRLLRKIARTAVLLVVTAASYLALVAALVLLAPLPRWRRRARNAVFRGWSRACLRLLGGRTRVEGPVPEAPFFLVCNHLSYVDVLVLASELDAFFIAKAEIRRWPLFGLLTRSVGTLFIDRELRRDVVRVNRLIARTLRQGYGVVLFPEGTSSQGYRVDRFRSALLEYAVSRKMPVHAAALTYATPAGELPANLSICWWGDAPFLAHLSRLLELEAFEATLRFHAEPVAGHDRKALARELHTRVCQVFTPVVSPDQRAHDPALRHSRRSDATPMSISD